MMMTRRGALGGIALAALGLGVTGCSGGGDPLKTDSGGGDAGAPLVVGSQQYYSNEIIAELFAQSIEHTGQKVTRKYQIGQREVYLPQVESGAIDLIPEYAGNLLQYYDKQSTAKTSEEIEGALSDALPSGMVALPFAQATDQDSFNVLSRLASKDGLRTLGDLTKLPQPVKVAANSELNKRPYGPAGMKSVYGVDIVVVPVEDSGGPLTVKALKDGSVQVANFYSTDPTIEENGFVTLDDPKLLILPQNVVPIASSRVGKEARVAVEKVTQALTTKELVAMNALSVTKHEKSAVIAKGWLSAHGII